MAITIQSLQEELSFQVNDSNSHIWDETDRVSAINSSIPDVVNRVLSYSAAPSSNSQLTEKIHEILSELQEIETKEVDHGGLDVNNDLVNRYYLTNGFVAAMVEVGSKQKFCKKVSATNLPSFDNYLNSGSDDSPKIVLFAGTLYVYVSQGSLPVSLTVYYIGAPYNVGINNNGSNKDRIINHFELNAQLKPIVMREALIKLYRDRAQESDIQARIPIELQQLEKHYEAIILGKIGETDEEDQADDTQINK